MYEDNFQRNVINETMITFLVEVYQSLIQYYDQLKDPIKDYFLHKIQNIFSNSKIQGILNESYQQNRINLEPEMSSFESHQRMKLKKLDYEVTLKSVNEEINPTVIANLIEKHHSAKINIDLFINNTIAEQGARFEEKFERRRQRTISRSMTALSFLASPFKEKPKEVVVDDTVVDDTVVEIDQQESSI